MPVGYGLMAAMFIAGIVALVVAALVNGVAAAAIVVAGVLFAGCGLMVLFDANGAGSGFITRYEAWLNRWAPWFQSPQPFRRSIMAFTGGLTVVMASH